MSIADKAYLWLRDKAVHHSDCATIPTTWNRNGDPVYLINHSGYDERMSLTPECTCGLKSAREELQMQRDKEACLKTDPIAS